MARILTKVPVEVEVRTGVDRQGLPSFDSPIEIEAVVRRRDEQVVASDGEKIRTHLTLWIHPDETPIPEEGDRITYESEAFIVAEFKRVEDFQANVVHYRNRCRKE